MNATSPTESVAAPPGRATLAGMLLISLGAMLVEIALTRVFSLVLYYHYASLVIGLAMLGLAIGGILVWRHVQSGQSASASPAPWAVLSGLATAGATALIVTVGPAGGLPAYALYAAMPFAMVGAVTAETLGRFAASSGRIYAADLAGAAMGTLLAIPLLEQFGGVNVLLIAAATMGWGGWLLVAWGQRPVPRLSIPGSLVAALALTALAVANPVVGLLDVDIRAIDEGKTMAAELRGDGQLAFTRWDAFARTDVVAPEGRSDVMYVFIDGAAGAAMLRFDGDPSAPSPLRADPGFFPFHERPAGDVLSIGPGGGKDVLMALMGGASKITAVEVNSGTVEAVRRFSEFNGGIYDRPEVEVAVDEGRSFLKRSTRLYDTIYLSLAMIQTAERTGYALTENYLYTVEAIRDYLDHLKPGGQLVFKLHGQPDLERVIRTATRALEEQGVAPDRVFWHMQALFEADPHGQHGDEIMYPVLVVRRDPYTISELEEHVPAAYGSTYLPLYFPGVGGIGPLDGIGNPGEQSGLSGVDAGIDLSPTTDDRPFFFLYSSGPPALVLVLIGITFVLGAITWVRLRRTVDAGGIRLRPSLLYFACLGFAFMLVELSLIQKLTLFLGHPTLAVTTVLFALLVSGAAGSWASARMGSRSLLPLASAALVGVLALAYTQLLPAVTAYFFDLATLQRAFIAAGLIIPLGALMGMPFPCGIRNFCRGAIDRAPFGEASSGHLAALAWIANGFASVLGSAATIAIAISYGFTASLAAGGIVYLAAALLAARATGPARRALRREPQSRSLLFGTAPSGVPGAVESEAV